MAQQSARRGRKNQMDSSCLEHALMIWLRSANSHTGPQLDRCTRGRTDGSIRLSAPLFPKNRLHLAGRPQMSPRPNWRPCAIGTAFMRSVNGSISGCRSRAYPATRRRA